MSVFVLDASYALTWCFLDRATPNTDATLKRLEAAVDSAIVPAIWPIEVANGLGKGVVRRKLTPGELKRFGKSWRFCPSVQARTLDVPKLLELAVHHNISVYDACYLQAARLDRYPLATNDHDLQEAAESYGLTVMTP